MLALKITRPATPPAPLFLLILTAFILTLVPALAQADEDTKHIVFVRFNLKDDKSSAAVEGFKILFILTMSHTCLSGRRPRRSSALLTNTRQVRTCLSLPAGRLFTCDRNWRKVKLHSFLPPPCGQLSSVCSQKLIKNQKQIFRGYTLNFPRKRSSSWPDVFFQKSENLVLSTIHVFQLT